MLEIFIHYYKAGNYYATAGGGICPINNIVASLDECKLAALPLGYTFKWKVTRDSQNYPPGCFWSDNKKVYFNPRITNTYTAFDVGGICSRQESTCDTVLLSSTGNSALAYNGWYKKNLFGNYRLHTTDSKGNEIYQIVSNQKYFIFKDENNNWMVSFKGLPCNTGNKIKDNNLYEYVI